MSRLNHFLYISRYLVNKFRRQIWIFKQLSFFLNRDIFNFSWWTEKCFPANKINITFKRMNGHNVRHSPMNCTKTAKKKVKSGETPQAFPHFKKKKSEQCNLYCWKRDFVHAVSRKRKVFSSTLHRGCLLSSTIKWERKINRKKSLGLILTTATYSIVWSGSLV